MSTPAAPPQPPAATPQRRPSSGGPEALDEVIKTTKSHGWWALWAIAGACLAALIWSIVAVIPLQSSATGMVSSFAYSTAVTSEVAGMVDFQGDIGHTLKQGDLIATVTPFDGSAPVDVLAPTEGQLVSVYVSDGQGVEPGTELAKLVRSPRPADGISLVTYLPANVALNFNEGDDVQVTVTNVANGATEVVMATINNVGNSPSTLEGMTNISGSATMSERWMEQSDGEPFRILLTITDWPSDDVSNVPLAGQLVDIVNTYGAVHPIQLLFGGA